VTEALVGFAVLLLLSFLTVPLAFATLIVGIAGFALMRGISPVLVLTSQQITDTATNYGLSMTHLIHGSGDFAVGLPCPRLSRVPASRRSVVQPSQLRPR
jgi:hypothetical protein